MTIEMEFSTDRPFDNTPETRAKMYGTNNPFNHMSSSSKSPVTVETEIQFNKVIVRLRGIGKADISTVTEDNFRNAVESGLPNCKHMATREVE